VTLRQLDCPLKGSLGEDLASLIEEEAISVSWYEKEPQHWALQVICEPSFEASLKDKIKTFFKEKALLLPNITSKPLPQKDWVSAVYQDFPPLTIGQFYIYGSHIQEVPPTGLLPLCIDAATAFGSGRHDSTKGCLKALSKLAEQKTFHCPLDMGCGSGILALAMARLWTVPVVACDNDPEAVRVTNENARINHVSALIEAQVSEGFAALQNRTFDIITANILARPLRQMAKEASQVLAAGGYMVLAGLLNHQAQDIIDTYESVGIKLVTPLCVNDWSTLIMQKETCG
jgi:ribosomal protein L11 methyltransferase